MLERAAALIDGPVRLWIVNIEGETVASYPAGLEFHQDPAGLLVEMRSSDTPIERPWCMAYPLKIEGKLQGALLADSPPEALATSLPENAARVLDCLSLALTLLANKGLERNAFALEILDKYRELNLLYNAGETITSCLHVEEIVHLLLKMSIQTLKAAWGEVRLLDENSGRLDFQESYGQAWSEVEEAKDVAQKALRSGQPEFKGNFLCAPLKTQQKTLGVITLMNDVGSGLFTAGDAKLLVTMAGQAAIALENASLYERVQAAKEQLQELNDLKSAFLSVITHELRTPFVSIDFSLQLIRRYGEEHFAPEQVEQFHELEREVSRAQAMIDGLIAFASFLSKQGTLKLETLNLVQVIESTISSLRTMAHSRGVAMTADLPGELPLLRGDRERLEEAIYHMVHNAIKFNRPGGKVLVRCYAEDSFIFLEVQDTGIGIPKDKLKAVWEPFCQLADPLRRGKEGLGLGLALIKYVVNAHNGQVWAESEEGVGSTFGFKLPAIEEPRQSHRKEISAGEDNGNREKENPDS